MTLSHSLRPIQRIERAWLEWPALFTSTSTRPKRSSVHRANAAAASASSRSTARAAQRPPAFSIVFATPSMGACRRPHITTCAPSAASILAAHSPMPLPAPVTIATCPSSTLMTFLPYCVYRLASAAEPASPSRPRPYRLLEVSDAGGAAVHHDLAHLVEHRRRRRVDERGENRQLDHRPVALGNRDQDRNLRPLEVVERHVVHAHDLLGVRRQCGRAPAPHHDGGDHEPRARRIVVERAQHRLAPEREPDFFVELAQGGGLGALPRLDAPAGQRVGPQPIGPP